MGFQVRSEQRAVPGRPDMTVVVLENASSRDAVEICPGIGFNCCRWASAGRDLLYCDPNFFQATNPNRSGIPILFPFPNRIRAGRFTWNGKEYSLPLNDSTKKNAIHGFASSRPWRVLDQAADGTSAWITAEFHGSIDAPECTALWPSDYRIRITHRLTAGRLRTEALVDNPGSSPLPFGLGYHHYFLAAPESLVYAPAAARWELVESVPSGKRIPLDSTSDLNTPRPFSELNLDDVLTELPTTQEATGLCLRGTVQELPGGKAVRLFASADFRELVVFTPPHRRAVCLEPYTCTSDAINLQQQGVDAGWRVLPPGGSWHGVVEIVLG